MPFKSYAEMRAMFAEDPEQAEKYVRHAKEKGLPVVSSKNPGYGAAAKRRMKTIQESRKETDQEIMSKRNKKIGY